MRLLLDTHALIWWFEGNERMSRSVRERLLAAEDEVLVSVVSAFEMTTKFRLGKLGGVAALLEDLPGYLASQAFKVLTLTLAHAEAGGKLSASHKDPFDRLLIAQAEAENAWLVSNETPFDQFGVRRLW